MTVRSNRPGIAAQAKDAAMKKDEMAKEEMMKKEEMAKDAAMEKEEMAKDAMAKDKMKK